MNIYKMDLKRSLNTLLTWTLAGSGFMAMIILLYPAIMQSDFMDMINEKLKIMPKELLDMFYMSGQDLRQLDQFFANMFQFVLMASCIYGAILGTGALSREENEGTIGFLYSKPVRRRRIVSAKLAAACTEYFIYFLVLCLVSMIAGICVRPADISLPGLISQLRTVLFGGMITGYTYLFLGFAISVFLKKARHATSLAVALFLITYVLGTVSAFGVIPFLKWISPYTYFVPKEVVMNGLSWMNALVCAIAMGVCAAAAYIVYGGKDFAV
jgi:ABC-2 type transport system permease protein